MSQVGSCGINCNTATHSHIVFPETIHPHPRPPLTHRHKLSYQDNWPSQQCTDGWPIFVYKDLSFIDYWWYLSIRPLSQILYSVNLYNLNDLTKNYRKRSIISVGFPVGPPSENKSCSLTCFCISVPACFWFCSHNNRTYQAICYVDQWDQGTSSVVI